MKEVITWLAVGLCVVSLVAVGWIASDAQLSASDAGGSVAFYDDEDCEEECCFDECCPDDCCSIDCWEDDCRGAGPETPVDEELFMPPGACVDCLHPHATGPQENDLL